MQPLEQIKKQFSDRSASFLSQSEAFNRSFNNLSVVRITLFVLAIIVLVFFANERNYLGVSLIMIVFPFVFGILLRKHQKIAFKKNIAQNLSLINEGEVLRLEGNLNKFDGGDRFTIENHPYAIDLDVFGKNSLFQLLSRCTTESAKRLLAGWLNEAASKEEIILRQDAVKELVPLLAWRQEFQASGMFYEDKESTIHTLLTWLSVPPYFASKTAYKLAAYLLPIITIAAITFYFLGYVHYLAPLAAILINIWVMRKAMPLAAATQEQTYESIKSLKAYEAMIEKMEKQSFQSQKLTSLQKLFAHEGFSAREEIRKLGTVLDWLNSRNNAFYFLFNIIFLIDIHLLVIAEKWKMRTSVDISQWFDAISEIEVLNSLAGLAYANPGYAFPALSNQNHYYQAENIGHPLLKSHARITNDFSFAGKGKIIVLTGSNMSGKSTFLRTLGTNAILAFMGSVVCASNFEIGHFQLFTSMRTVDSLEENVSSFYAELRRLKQMLGAINETTPVFFMLDEILKGTNSHDRHKGAAALIRQLGTKNALGIVSTHDLELGSLANESEDIYNYNFSSTIQGDEIIFDYKLHEGICESFNASKLMQIMGIEIENS